MSEADIRTILSAIARIEERMEGTTRMRNEQWDRIAAMMDEKCPACMKRINVVETRLGIVWRIFSVAGVAIAGTIAKLFFGNGK